MKNRLYEKYQKEIAPALAKELGRSNVFSVPKVTKITVNAGVGSFRDNREALESFVEELGNLTGQRPYFRKARLSEAGFKIRKGDIVGVAVTLRGAKMWAFLDKLANVVLPRVRDFRGLKTTAFDKSGNYSIGIKEHTIFPEVNPNVVKGIRSLQVTIVTNAGNKEESELLLRKLGLPLKEKK